MMRIEGRGWWAAGAGLALLTGCQGPSGPRFDPRQTSGRDQPSATNQTAAANFTPVDLSSAHPDLLKPPSEPYTAGPGDRLEIEILGDPDPAARAMTTVGPDGKIYFQLLSGLDVWGLTLPQIKARIEKEMLAYVREAPQVSVALRAVQSQRVWLLGRLNAPGVYTLAGPTTLLEALVAAGGASRRSATLSARGTALPLDEADLGRSFLLRGGNPVPVDFYRLLREGDMSQNIYLRPDDFIYLPSRAVNEVFVLGAVDQPKAVGYENGMSLVAAIAAAQGTVKNAYLSHVAVVRGSLTKPRIAVLDYRGIISGKQPDAPLEPGDIVYVPFTPYRTLVRYLDLITTTFVQTVGINEGTRAVAPNGIPVGVNIGVSASGLSPAVAPAPAQ